MPNLIRRFIKGHRPAAPADQPATLQLSAPVELTAAAPAEDGKPAKLPSFSISAYNGGAMRLSGWYHPTVVDLAGMKAAKSTAVLRDHDLGRIVGHATEIKIDQTGVYLAGNVSGVGADANEIVASAKNGFPWQASIGAEVNRSEFLEAGKTATVNGQTFTGPLNIVRRATLKEVSFVALGADDSTSAQVAATSAAQGQQNMPIEAAERENLTKIIDATRDHPDIRAKALEEGWTLDKTEFEVMKASMPKAYTGGKSRSSVAGVSHQTIIAAAVLERAGMGEIGAKQLGETAANMASDLRARTLLDVAAHALRMEGIDPPAGHNELLRAAFSSSSLPVALGLAAEKTVAWSYNQTPATWRSWCRVKDVRNFKQATTVRAYLNSGRLLRMDGNAELKHAALGEETYTHQADTWARMFGISRKDLINDDAGVFTDLAIELGRQGVRAIADEVYRVLLANGGNFFAEADGNLIDDDLAAAGLEAAITKFRNRTDASGLPIDIAPKALIVPPALEFTARALLRSGTLERSQATDDRQPTGNPFAELAALEVEPRLSNTSIHANATATRWYLVADPQAAPAVIISALHGKLEPTVEMSETSFNTLGVEWRCYSDFGVDLADPRAAVLSTGDAE